MTKPIILITGATGHQGGEAARLLLRDGHVVHAFVRNASDPAALALKLQGATLVEGDFFKPASITAAMAGVTAVFLNTYPSLTDLEGEIQTAKAFVEAALQAGTVTNFVVSTVYGANRFEDWSVLANEYPFLTWYFNKKHAVEKIVRGTSITSLHGDKRTITVSYPPEWKQPHLDAFDVGKFAAAALAPFPFSASYKDQEIDLISEYLTWEEVAKGLGEAAGVEVKLEFRTSTETEAVLKAGSLPALEAQIFSQTMKDVFDVKTLAIYGIELGTFGQYLEREKSAIKTSLRAE